MRSPVQRCETLFVRAIYIHAFLDEERDTDWLITLSSHVHHINAIFESGDIDISTIVHQKSKSENVAVESR